MSYHLLIKNGMVIDGSGLPPYRADVGVKAGNFRPGPGKWRSDFATFPCIV